MKLFTLFAIALLNYSVSGHALDCATNGHQDLAAEVIAGLKSNPLTCTPNKVHLSFDDGPSPSVTPEILKELKLRNVKASFFVTTTNLDPDHPKYKDNRALVAQTLNEGHLIADHGHDHHAHDLRMDGNGKILEEGFTQSEREKQLSRSIDLLNWSTQGKFSKQRPLLFRFPYGRGAMPSERELKHKVNSGEITLQGNTYAEQLKEYRTIGPALQTVASSGFSHLGWNHDSHDSSYGVKAPDKEILKKYIRKNLEGLCAKPQVTKVALFHDIKEMNIQAIPIILDVGKCLGLKFISAQEMAKDIQLAETGVLITREKILAGPVEQVIKGQQAAKNVGDNQCSEEIKDKFCYSEQYKKYYPHCSGGNSVCYEARWYSRYDPIITENCQIKD